MSERPYQFLRSIIEEHKPTGWAIEFGVYYGTSLSIIAEYMPVIGLDSFDGLPEDWREGYLKGEFFVPRFMGERPELPFAPNALIVDGLFEDTLPPLVERGLPPIGLVHIDCDLYSSTVTALEGLADDLDVGTIISFDEFQDYPGYEQHEFKAWAEFVAEYRVEYTDLGENDQQRAFMIKKIGGKR